mmetsp:Transcript_21265/g.34252  ORF Transcript_21265/g.34252 Transcript_21265/m.34252 type:complete len:250 (-) Transcript_21265:1295-2044(-)
MLKTQGSMRVPRAHVHQIHHAQATRMKLRAASHVQTLCRLRLSEAALLQQAAMDPDLPYRTRVVRRRARWPFRQLLHLLGIWVEPSQTVHNSFHRLASLQFSTKHTVLGHVGQMHCRQRRQLENPPRQHSLKFSVLRRTYALSWQHLRNCFARLVLHLTERVPQITGPLHLHGLQQSHGVFHTSRSECCSAATGRPRCYGRRWTHVARGQNMRQLPAPAEILQDGVWLSLVQAHVDCAPPSNFVCLVRR